MRYRIGDRVTIESLPGTWRITALDNTTAWLQGTDEFARTLASLSPCGTIGVSKRKIQLDTTKQETLLS